MRLAYRLDCNPLLHFRCRQLGTLRRDIGLASCRRLRLLADRHRMMLRAVGAPRNVVCKAEPEPMLLRITDRPPAGGGRQLQEAFRQAVEDIAGHGLMLASAASPAR